MIIDRNFICLGCNSCNKSQLIDRKTYFQCPNCYSYYDRKVQFSNEIEVADIMNIDFQKYNISSFINFFPKKPIITVWMANKQVIETKLTFIPTFDNLLEFIEKIIKMNAFV